jgi:hypothetical protein
MNEFKHEWLVDILKNYKHEVIPIEAKSLLDFLVQHRKNLEIMERAFELLHDAYDEFTATDEYSSDHLCMETMPAIGKFIEELKSIQEKPA